MNLVKPSSVRWIEEFRSKLFQSSKKPPLDLQRLEKYPDRHVDSFVTHITAFSLFRPFGLFRAGPYLPIGVIGFFIQKV